MEIKSSVWVTARRGENTLLGELRDGRGNCSCRGLSGDRQVRDLPGIEALSLQLVSSW